MLKQKLGHRKVDWSLQVDVMVKDMKVEICFSILLPKITLTTK